jgi:C-terminal processing protease CtpA/Prc
VRALWALTSGREGADVRLTIDDGSGPRDVTLRYASGQPPSEKRPDAIIELVAGIWYVDLTRATAGQLTPRLSTLAAARGVVFDLRGYPTDAGRMILAHLLEAPETDRWMHVAQLVGPFAEPAGWQDLGWDLKPAEPTVGRRRVFMTDARAISYAESVMGYVADRKLATIVGSRTAGTNGDVASFTVPSGLRIRFTGLRVTGHDGRSPFHLVGVKPDVPVAPTIAGLRRGRDEVLERAIAVIDATP